MATRQQAGFSNVVRGDEELGKYQNKYEESMNPFESFRSRVCYLFLSFFSFLFLFCIISDTDEFGTNRKEEELITV